MTVEVDTARVSYTGAGTTGPFTIPFYFLANADIRAIKVTIADGTEDELALTTDFTLSGAGDEEGGTLTLVASLSSSYKLVIFRDPEVLQESAYPRNDQFPSQTHEEVADRLTMIAQRHADLLTRSIRMPEGDTSGDSMVLPPAVDRPSKVLGFDANGDMAVYEPESAVTSAANVTVLQSGTGATPTNVQDDLRARSVIVSTQFGSASGGDDTTALQNAINAHKYIEIPDGTHKFSSLTIPRNRVIYGHSRAAILEHTGSGTAIALSDASSTDPDGSTPYIDAGWVAFRDFQLFVKGTKGFEVGKTRSSFTEWEGVYIRHSQDGGSYTAGSTAISCDNATWQADYSTYDSGIRRVFIRGFETAVSLNDTVATWTFQGFHFINCKNQFSLNDVGSILIGPGYMESNISAARGIVFGADGGNSVEVMAGFEFTHADANSFAYDFSAGGTWRRIYVRRGTKYLLQGDGDAVEGKKYTGTVSTGFVEERDYLRSSDSLYYPLLYTGADHYQHRKPLRVGGVGHGNGKLIIGRSDLDTVDADIEIQSNGDLFLTSSNGGFALRRRSGTKFFEVVPFSGAIRSLVDNSVVGGFTMDAAASKAVSNTVVTANSRIFLFPTNAAAATLQSGASALYISARTASTSFTVSTANAGSAAGTETFNFLVLN